jgi:hypothetical protein
MTKPIRRITGALFILLGVAGLILMVFGAAGCLLARQYSVRVASRTCESAQRLLAITAESTTQIKATLEKARANLAEVRAESSTQRQSEKTPRTGNEKLARLAHDLSPQLDKARQITAIAAKGAVVLTTLIEGLNLIPLAPKQGLDADQFNDISDRVTDLIIEAKKLDMMLRELSGRQAGLEEVEKRTARMSERLAEAETKVGQLSNRVAEAQVRVGEVQSSLYRWITMGVAMLMAVLIWLGLGQWCLVVQGLSWCKGSVQ